MTGFNTDRLAAFVARCWGEPRGLRLEVRALRGGLESAGVAEVTARFSDARDRPRSAAFVIKALEGTPAREADIYQHLVSPLGEIAPALLGIERDGPERCLLFLERVRPVRRWPWREERAARRLLERLAHLHATADPVEAREILSDWDYESELVERTRPGNASPATNRVGEREQGHDRPTMPCARLGGRHGRGCWRRMAHGLERRQQKKEAARAGRSTWAADRQAMALCRSPNPYCGGR